MAPELWELLEAGPGDEEVRAIVRLRRPGVVPPGLRVVAQFGEIATCRLRRDRILEVRRHEAVRSLKAPELVTPDAEAPGLLSAPAGTGAGAALRPGDHRRPRGLGVTGRGVVVAAADWGCDVAHPSFRRPDGRTRLLALWDQSARRGRRNRYGYGAVHARADIDRALQARDPYAALGYHPARSDRAGAGAHGTHVLDIAAGNGRGGGPLGLAPEADLVFVQLDTSGMSRHANLGDSVTVLEAVDFVARASGRRPWVLNASLGTHGGPHDGLTPCELGLDRAVSAAPGRCIVQSCGNYYERQTHASGTLRPGQGHTLRFVVDAADVTPNEVEVWYPGKDAFAVELRGPGGVRVGPVRLGERAEVRLRGRLVGRLYHRAHDPNNHDHHVNLFLYRGAPAGRWALRLLGEDVVDGRYHAWIERDAACRGCQARFVGPDVDPAFTTNSICNGLRTIVVGAYDAHDPDRRPGPFSSQGPTRDGRTKPDVLAPGVRVLAARSAPAGARESGAPPTRKSGTSMAAPHVTGAVALLYEAAGRPLRVEETRRLLLGAARPPPPTLSPWRVGSGYLDVEAAVTAARGAAEPPDGSPDPLTPRREDPMTHQREDPTREGTDLDGSPLSDVDVEDVGPEDVRHEDAGSEDTALEHTGSEAAGSEGAGRGGAGPLVVPRTGEDVAETIRSLGTVTIHGSNVDLATDGAAPVHTATSLDAALRFALAQGPVPLAVTGDPYGGPSFQVYRWGPQGPFRLPGVIRYTPPVTDLNRFPGMAAVLLYGLPYVAADPSDVAGPWVAMPRLRGLYALDDRDLDAQRDAWIDGSGRRGGLVRAGAQHPVTGAALDRAALRRLSVPALRVLLVRHRRQAIAVTRVSRRGRDAGGVAHGLTLPVTGYPVSEPACYLPVIARAEGRLESVNAWDRGAGISVGPVQINAQRGALLRFLWRLWEKDPALFRSAFAPLGWTMRQHDGHPDLLVRAGGVDHALHGSTRRAAVRRNVGYFESGTPGGARVDPAFRRRLAERFREVLVYPHVQDLVVETSAWWLGAGLRQLHAAGIPALDPRRPDRDLFRLKALLLSCYVRFSGYLGGILRALAAHGTVAAKLAHVEDAVRRAVDPARATTSQRRQKLQEHRQILLERVRHQRGAAARVFEVVERQRGEAQGAGRPAPAEDATWAGAAYDVDPWEDADVWEDGYDAGLKSQASEDEGPEVEYGSDAGGRGVERVGFGDRSTEGLTQDDDGASGGEAYPEPGGVEGLEPGPDEHDPAFEVPSTGEAVVEQAEAAVAPGGGAVSGEAVLREIARPFDVGAAAPSPGALFDALVGFRGGEAGVPFEVVAGPGETLVGRVLRPGDVLVRVALGEGGGHVAVLAGAETYDVAGAEAAGLRPESGRPGVYAHVVEGGAFPHRRADRYARRVADAGGRVPRGQMVVRLRPETAATEWAGFAETIPSSRLRWEGAAPAQLAFMRRVYDVNLARSSRRGTFTPDVPATGLSVVEGHFRARHAVAVSCRHLLAHARAAAAREGVRVEVGLTSAYRSASRQFELWQRYFPRYYARTQAQRRELEGGEHGGAAVQYLARFVRVRIATPGFSNHNDGRAVDFRNVEDGDTLENESTDAAVAAWQRSWFWRWLGQHAATYGFHQNTAINEPWHWEHRAPTGDDTSDALETSRRPRLDPSARLEWVNLAKARGSDGRRHLYYVVGGAPGEDKAYFDLRVTNTNAVYNHLDVETRVRLLDVAPGGRARTVLGWTRTPGPELEDEDRRVVRFHLTRPRLEAAYNADHPRCRLDAEYHWRESGESHQSHYNRTSLAFFLVSPVELMLDQRSRLTPRDVHFNDPARHRDDFWIPVSGITFTEDIREPVSIELSYQTSLSRTRSASRSASQRTSQSRTRTHSTSNTFSMSLNGEVSQGGSATANIEVFELGVERMFKLGGSVGYSRTVTDVSSSTRAREFARSASRSEGYARQNETSQRVRAQIQPAPPGTSVSVYLYPTVAYFAVPYVRFHGVNRQGQATRRTPSRHPVAVPFITGWRLTTRRT